jgi:hypothetical protein
LDFPGASMTVMVLARSLIILPLFLEFQKRELPYISAHERFCLVCWQEFVPVAERAAAEQVTAAMARLVLVVLPA